MSTFKKTKCFMKWCYSPSRHEDGTCDKFCTYNTVYAQTNADRIRSMIDEELAEFMYEYSGSSPNCDRVNLAYDYKSCKECWLDWLRKEVESEGKE